MKNRLFLGVSAVIATGLLSVPFVADALTPNLLFYFLVDVSSSNKKGESNAIDTCHALFAIAQPADEIVVGQFADKSSISYGNKIDNIEGEVVCSSVTEKRRGIGESDGTDAGLESALSKVVSKKDITPVAIIAIDSTEQVRSNPADWVTPAKQLLNEGIPLVFVGASLELEEKINSYTKMASHEMLYICGEEVNEGCLQDAISSARSKNGFDLSNLIGGH